MCKWLNICLCGNRSDCKFSAFKHILKKKILFTGQMYHLMGLDRTDWNLQKEGIQHRCEKALTRASASLPRVRAHVQTAVWYLFEELQVDSHGQEVPHGAGTMIHEALLAECYRLPLRSPQGRGGEIRLTHKYKSFFSDCYLVSFKATRLYWVMLSCDLWWDCHIVSKIIDQRYKWSSATEDYFIRFPHWASYVGLKNS